MFLAICQRAVLGEYASRLCTSTCDADGTVILMTVDSEHGAVYRISPFFWTSQARINHYSIKDGWRAFVQKEPGFFFSPHSLIMHFSSTSAPRHLLPKADSDLESEEGLSDHEPDSQARVTSVRPTGPSANRGSAAERCIVNEVGYIAYSQPQVRDSPCLAVSETEMLPIDALRGRPGQCHCTIHNRHR